MEKTYGPICFLVCTQENEPYTCRGVFVGSAYLTIEQGDEQVELWPKRDLEAGTN